MSNLNPISPHFTALSAIKKEREYSLEKQHTVMMKLTLLFLFKVIQKIDYEYFMRSLVSLIASRVLNFCNI